MLRSDRLTTSDFQFELPKDRIAQHPAPSRDASRLMTLDRATGAIGHHRFHELPGLLKPGDLLIANDTRVLPARLFARVGGREVGRERAAAAREVEVLLLREEPAAGPERIWSALARPAKILKPGTLLSFTDPAYRGDVRGSGERGVRHIAFTAAGPAVPEFEAWLARVGHVPLPPYIDRPDEPEDRERYQTIFAREPGSVAAPTAALHFTEETLGALGARGIEVAFLTLHVGAGTFRPVAGEHPEEHALDPEAYRVPPETAAALKRVRARGGRVIAVGTTSVRALESWAKDGEPTEGTWRDTSLLILPPFEFRVVTGMVTNFHLPRSSLLMLVCALAGVDHVLHAYAVAVAEGYRFYSYGDAMLVT
ncbi:MAG TPA: tRNA preQ1(34) S-adenosylmethionine ribosyltransferase-isomerase QueA [Candidatus Eisenbacteria bacterium]